MGVGRAELWGASKQQIPPGVGLGGGVKFVYVFLEGGAGNLETPLAIVHPWVRGICWPRAWRKVQKSAEVNIQKADALCTVLA